MGLSLRMILNVLIAIIIYKALINIYALYVLSREVKHSTPVKKRKTFKEKVAENIKKEQQQLELNKKNNESI